MTGQLKILETLPVKNGLQVWGDGHRKLVEPCLNSDVEWVQRELDVPVEAINSTLEADLVAPYQVRAALEAEQEGFDAVVLGCKLEPGVQAAKEACRIPVVSELEAALHVACLVARRFSLLIPGRGPADTNLLWELVERHGLAPRVASIQWLQAGSLDFAAGRAGLEEASVQAAQTAITDDGAQAIIPYGSITILNHLRSQLDVPVVHPLQAAACVAQILALMRLGPSKESYPVPSRIADLREVMGL